MSIFTFLDLVINRLKRFWEERPFWLRVLMAWSIGIAFLINEYQGDFDLRFKFRGTYQIPQDIVQVLISDKEWRESKHNPIDSFQVIKSLTGADTQTDLYYWDQKFWANVLNYLLEANPTKIGITFYFGKNLGADEIKPELKSIFQNSKIYWSAMSDSEGQLHLPRIAQQAGTINLIPDYDGTTRRFNSQLTHIPHLGIALSRNPNVLSEMEYTKNILINYQSKPGTIPTYSAFDVVSGKIPKEVFQNKTILIGSKDSPNHMIPTPLGFMTKSEVIANIIDNANNSRWPIKFPVALYAVYLFALVLLSLLIVYYYPQTLALAILTAATVIITSLATWVFDQFYIWIPIIPTIVQFIAVYIIFIGYKLTQNERKSWKLEQDRRNLYELEQLKNNFISLISHDLKTPIAKIQGIVDRLMTSESNPNINTDLTTLKKSSADLQKYIHTILQVSRVESVGIKLYKDARDINQIIDEAIEQVQPLAAEKSIIISKNLEPLFSIEIDGNLIYEVIANLLENAIKYTPNGGSILIESKEKNDSILITVSDTGDGIPKTEIPHVWEKFYRGKKHDMNTKGTGLGLYLVKYFIELHKGHVFIESTVGKGTLVGFSIPYHQDAAEVMNE